MPNFRNKYINASNHIKKPPFILYRSEMVRTSKSTASSVAPASVVAAPVKEVAPKKTAAKKATKTAVAETVVAPVPTSTPVVDSPALTNEVVADASTESSVGVKMNEFSAKFQQVLSLFATLKADYKTLEKTVARELKAAQKTTQKKSKRSGNRAPSGFVKPTRISDELASFLGKPSGTELARTAVSKEINAYIRANNLQDKENGRKIIPDAKLTALLKIQASDELTYFNLQRFMKHHFVKTELVATA
jgi:chromatin remodeling complex protein RSC6